MTMTHALETSGPRTLHEAAWPDMFANLQTAYAELTQAQFELEQRTREVSEARDLFQRVIESMSEALFLLDRSGRIVQTNRAAGDLLEYGPREMAGRPFAGVWGNDEIPATPWQLLERTPRGTLTDMEIGFRGRQGRSGFVSASSTLVRDQQGKITGVLVIVRDVTTQKHAKEQIQASLREKELLLKEIHHRVKNNLQVISSLLSLQSAHMEDPAARELLRESQSRVRSMALVHEKLYQSKDLGGIDFERYVRDLAAWLFRTYGADPGRQVLRVEVEDVVFGIDVAIPCGLIISELVSNCLKHAFPDGRKGEIAIALRRDDERQFTLTVRDDGTGFPPDLDVHNSESLGLQLVNTLVSQLGGEIEVRAEGGTEWVMTLCPRCGS